MTTTKGATKSRGRVARARVRGRPRSRLRTSNGWQFAVVDGPPCGPDVRVASFEEVMAAMETLPEDLAWNEISDLVVPAFQRVRPLPAGAPEPLRMVVPPGLSVGFAIDVGPALVTIGEGQLEMWGLTAAELSARAFENLATRIASHSAEDVVRGTVDGVPVQMLQAIFGDASTFVLLPDGLGRILGDAPQLLIAPMRNLLVSMPLTADRALAAFMFEEIASQDPNCLAPAAFVFRDGAITPEPLGDAYAAD